MFANLEEQIQTDAGCRQLLRELKYPNGLMLCSSCGDEQLYEIRTRDVMQCRKCKKQTSLTSGTLFHGCRIDLSKPFRMLLDMAKGVIKSVSKQAEELDMEESTNWRWRQKIRIKCDKEIPHDEVMRIDREYLNSVLFKPSAESRSENDNLDHVEPEPEPQDDSQPELQFSPRSEKECKAISNVLRFIRQNYHGVSKKYSQLYSTESRIVERRSQFGFEGLLSLLIRAGPIKCIDIGTYSSPKIIDLPLPA